MIPTWFLCLWLTLASPPPSTQPLPDTLKAQLEELYKTAKKWGVGENREKVPEARRQLAAYGEAALRFLFTEKVRTLNALELRVFKFVVQRNRRRALPYLHQALESENDTVRRVALWLVGEVKDSSALPKLQTMLTAEGRPRMRARVLGALGKIGDTTAASWVAPYLKDTSRFVRYAAASALVKLHQPRWVPVYLTLLRDPDFQLHQAGLAGLAREPATAIDSLEARWREEVRPRDLQALARVLASPDLHLTDRQRRAWRARLVPLRHHPDPAVRLYAAKALKSLGGKSLRSLLLAWQEQETDPMVWNTLRLILQE